jgi:hypothetical protein
MAGREGCGENSNLARQKPSNLYEYPPGFGVAIISMPSSSNLPNATADDDNNDPVAAYL